MRHRLDLRHPGEMFCGEYCIVLPAGVAEYEVAGVKSRRFRRHHLGNATSRHHGVGFDGRAIRRAMHPGAIGGIERDVADAQQCLAMPRFGNRGIGQLEMLRPEFPGRLLDQQDLAIDARAHDDPPLAMIDATDAQESCTCIHCALRATLTAAHVFHNGKVLVHHARLLRR
jgi:hypothetical protein